MTLHRGSEIRRGREHRNNRVGQAARALVEGLEERRLLTRLFAGESMVVNTLGNVPVRIQVTGDEDTYVDFIGANLDESDNPALADIPATIYTQGSAIARREALGGFAGGNGIDTIRRVTSGEVGSSFTIRPFDALATNDKGATYAVDRVETGENTTTVQVRSVNNTNGNSGVVQDITDEIVTAIDSFITHPSDPDITSDDFTSADIVSVYGADFRLGHNTELYFLMRASVPFVTGQNDDGDEFGDVELPILMKYDRDAHTVTRVGFFGLVNNDNAAEVSDFTFVSEDEIVFFGTLDEDDDPGLYSSEISSLQPQFVASVTEGLGDDEEEITELDAIEYIPSLNAILAVDSDRLIRINFDNAVGRARELGTLVDPDVGDADPARGAAIGDLSWNPTLKDKFFAVGSKGVLLGADLETNELVGIDTRDRFAEIGLYAVVSDRTNENTLITISVVEPNPDIDDNPALAAQLGTSTPFAGNSGGISVVEVDEGMDNPTVISTGNDGGLFMGLRTPDEDEALTIPVLQLNSNRETQGGNFIGSKQQVPGLPTKFSPGVYLENSVGSFMFGGTITGKVNIGGSVDVFYAGNILTGHARGEAPLAADDEDQIDISDDNFFVAGDLRYLISNNIGGLEGQPDEYNPETDIHVKGRFGASKAQFEYNAAVEVNANNTGFNVNSLSIEKETIVNRGETEDDLIGIAFDTGRLANQVITANDTFATAELLTTHVDSETGKLVADIVGNVNLSNDDELTDPIDFYQLPLMAGQKISVQLEDDSNLIASNLDIDVVVIDPEGREYASNRSNVDNANYAVAPFEVKIDKPGSWRFQIRRNADNDDASTYRLTIGGVGDLSFGGMVSLDRISMRNESHTLRVHNGDMGTIQAIGILDQTPSDAISGATTYAEGNTMKISGGNLREIDALQLSVLKDGLFSRFPEFLVPKGSVGRIHSDTFAYFNIGLRSPFTDSPYNGTAIGGDYQLIDVVGDFSANLVANGGIGVIRAGSISAEIIEFPGYYAVDVDGRGRDGFIDLIDSGGNIGSFTYGGPAIRVGRPGGGGDGGGNVRFMRAAGNVYRDFFFGTGASGVRTALDESVVITDDSGAKMTITPIANGSIRDTPTGNTGGSGIPNPFGNFVPPDPFGRDTIPSPFGGDGGGGDGGDDGDNPLVVGGELTVSIYAVRSGGVIVHRIDVEEGGLSIQTEQRNGNSRGEVGTINFEDEDTAGIVVSPDNELFRNPSQRTPLRLAAGTTRELTLSGAPTGVFAINVGDGGEGNMTRIVNLTRGEIVNVSAGDVGELESENLGFAVPNANVVVAGLPLDEAVNGRMSGEGFENGLNSYPFNDQRNAIVMNNAIEIAARRALGNIGITNIVQEVIANSDNSNETKVTEGVVGPIASMFEIRNVEIGEGLMPSGTGNVGFAGIYSANDVGRITNLNGSGDIRGDIVGGQYVEQISLTGSGSIINADIYALLGFGQTLVGITYTGFNNARETIRFSIDAFSVNPRENGLNGMGSINVTGKGGIISTLVQALDFGKVTVKQGFGVINSQFGSSSGANMDGITADGFGIRGSRFEGGSFVRVLEATGDGTLLDVNDFDSSVRSSQGHNFDQIDGTFLTPTNDLHLYMGTNANKGTKKGVTEAGVIENSIFSANRSVDRVQAWRIRSRPIGSSLGLEHLYNNTESELFAMQLKFGDDVGTITTLDDIDGLRIVGGNVDLVSVGAAMRRTRIIASGLIAAVNVARDIKGNSYILASGNSGEIGTITTGGALNGVVTASDGIGTITVGTDLGSRQVRSFDSIGSLIVGDDVLAGSYVRASQRMNILTITDDLQEGATIRAKTFGTVLIGGDEDGDLVRK